MDSLQYALPLISVEGLDVKTYATQTDLETHLEHWWVEDNCGSVFDASGKLLRLEPRPPSVAIVGFALPKADKSKELKNHIVDSLRSVNVDIDSDGSLEQVIAALEKLELQEQAKPNPFHRFFRKNRD
jgi:hypothetical protein